MSAQPLAAKDPLAALRAKKKAAAPAGAAGIFFNFFFKKIFLFSFFLVNFLF